MTLCTIPTAPTSLSARTGIEARRIIRAGEWSGHTSGTAPNHVQGNVAILPTSLAGDFLRFCQRNPKPCPLLGVSEPGDPHLPGLGEDLDIRTDVPAYRIWRHGELVEEVTDIRDYWRDDLVTFVLGCSFSFEQALIDAAIPLRHILEGRNVAMYRTNIPTVPAGVFHGPMVVSMRPMTAAHAIRAVQVTARVFKEAVEDHQTTRDRAAKLQAEIEELRETLRAERAFRETHCTHADDLAKRVAAFCDAITADFPALAAAHAAGTLEHALDRLSGRTFYGLTDAAMDAWDEDSEAAGDA